MESLDRLNSKESEGSCPTSAFSRQTWTLPAVHRGLLYVAQNTKDYVSGKRARVICYDIRGE